MTETQEKKIYNDALETLVDLDRAQGGFTKEQFILYGAAKAIAREYTLSDAPVSRNSHPVERVGAYRPPETFADFAALVEDELSDAYKYLQYYLQTGKESDRQLARQEETHAAHWIGEAKRVANDPAQSGKIKQWLKRHDEILAQLGAANRYADR